MKTLELATIVSIVSLLGSACREVPTSTTLSNLEGTTATVSSSPAWAEQIVDRTGPASTYALLLPHAWNGGVVFYAHGFRNVDQPIDLPTADGVEALRDALGELGFAFAYSSFDENGYALKNGMIRTRQLRDLFAEHFGPPSRSLLAGHSLGGGISIALAEKHPTDFDGAVAMCGIVGGTEAQLDYVANVRVLFDFFYPDVLPGNAASLPKGVKLDQDIIVPALQAIQAAPAGIAAISQIEQTPLPFAAPDELVQSALTALGFHARGIDNFLDLTHGHFPFDNTSTVYTGVLPPTLLAAINVGVDRFESDPAAENYAAKYFTPTGELEVPVLTLHTSRDPSVPDFHEDIYEAVVASAGRTDLLVRRTITRYGHCGFTTAEMVDAITDLAAWIETGARPAP